jgi:hypothetical protein
MKTPTQDSRCPGRDSNRAISKYKSRDLPLDRRIQSCSLLKCVDQYVKRTEHTTQLFSQLLLIIVRTIHTR